MSPVSLGTVPASSCNIGVPGNLAQRIFEHKRHLTPGFTSCHEVTKLVYGERFDDVNMAIRQEQRLKEWKRNWKKDLIEKYNPDWRDLYAARHWTPACVGVTRQEEISIPEFEIIRIL